jgi:hypothetical protein
MIIHQPETFLKDGNFIIWSRIELERPRENFPKYLWYKIPEKYGSFISTQSDAFLLPGLLAGMHFEEDIEVRGNISPRLAYALDEYQFVLHFRMPNEVQPVTINYSKLLPGNHKPTAVGTTISGGVDSFFTLYKHLPPNQPIAAYRISHGLFIMGFDIRFQVQDRYEQLFIQYAKALQEIGVELIRLETNLISVIVPRMIFPHFYGPVLAGSAHLFGGLFRRFYIASSKDYSQIKIRTSSSDPLSDPLLSSDTLDIIHHGATHKRVDKVKEISDWDLVQKNLRVCFRGDSDEPTLNCSWCEKCTRTMTPIYALGKMEQFSTFKKPFRSNRDGLRLARKFNPRQGYVPEFFPFVREHKPDFLPWLFAGVALGYIRYWSIQLIPGIARKWLQRFGYFIDPLDSKYAFEDRATVALIQSKDNSTG